MGSAWTDEEFDRMQEYMAKLMRDAYQSKDPIMDWNTGEFTEDMHGKVVKWIAGPQKQP